MRSGIDDLMDEILKLKHGESHVFDEWQDGNFEIFNCNDCYVLFAHNEYCGTPSVLETYFNNNEKLKYDLNNTYC